MNRLVKALVGFVFDGLHFWNPARSGLLGGLIAGFAIFGVFIAISKLF